MKGKTKIEFPLYDLSRLPEEYLRNEFPEYYNSIKKRKEAVDSIMYLF